MPVFAGRQARAEPQPRQLLRRDRAGRVLRRARRAGHRLHQRSAARRPHPLLRRHPDLAARRRRTSTRSRSTRRSRRCTTTSATACTARRSTAAASSYEPNSLGGGCPFQAGDDGLRVVPGAARGRRPQGPRQAGALRRPLHPGDAVLEQPDAGREDAHRQRLPLRAVEGADAGDPRAHGVRAAERRRPSWPRRSPRASGSATLPRADAEGPSGRRDAGGRRVAGAVAVRPAGRRRRPRRGASPSSSPTAATASPSQALAERLSREGAVPRFVGPSLGAVEAASGEPLEVDASIEATPSVLFDAVVIPDGERAVRRARRGRTGAGVPEGPVPALQADPRRSARAPALLRAAGIPRRAARRANPIPAC